METVKGKYADAVIFTEDLEDYARAQIQMICDNEVAVNSKIRIMPDVHPGIVGPIGLTMTVGERIIPNLLGIDIGCGMSLIMSDFGKILGPYEDMAMIIGVTVGIIGGVPISLAYPIYNLIVRRERKKIAPEIIRLTDELMK